MNDNLKQKANVLSVSAPTMTSLELVDYINADRKAKAESEGLIFPCKQYRQLQHRSFMGKVPKVLSAAAAKFFAVDIYVNGTGGEVERDIYRFPKREACLMAMSYSYELQAQVFDHMTALEGSKAVNIMDLSGLLELTAQEMQNRVTQAEKFSFSEHGQRGSGLMALRKREKKAIKKAEELVRSISQFSICDLGAFPEQTA